MVAPAAMATQDDDQNPREDAAVARRRGHGFAGQAGQVVEETVQVARVVADMAVSSRFLNSTSSSRPSA